MKEDSLLANNLKATRTRLGLSQQQLAETAGITRQTIGGVEAGLYAPSAIVALRLARALGCRVEELFWLEEDLPTIEALPVGDVTAPTRVALAQIEGHWVAHPLVGPAAFRSEMVPADGVGESLPESGRLAVKLLDDVENLGRTVLIAGCTPALSLWARSAERWHPGLRVHWIHANSMAALGYLARGEVHGAGIHLSDPTNQKDNASFVRDVLPGREVTLINLGIWEEGFVLQPGNPLNLNTVSDLAQEKVTWINREAGAGARLLLDSLLRDANIPASAVHGYTQEVTSHQDVAERVRSGRADVGMSTASVAAIYGLSFVPFRQVRYELALLQSSLTQEPIRQLLNTLEHRWVRSQLRVLGGYDTTGTGESRLIIPFKP